MARTSPRRVTRFDRQEASRTAVSLDLGPAVRGLIVVVAVLLVAYAVSALVPAGSAFGGPLQGEIAGRASFTSIRKTGGGAVTLVVPVPWNAGVANAVLDRLVPIDPDGVQIKRAGVAPPGSVALSGQRGFPPTGVILSPLQGSTIYPGVGDLDGFQIAVGLTGEGTLAGFALHYRVGEESFVAILPAGALLCPADCPGRAEAEDAQRDAVARLSAFVQVPER